MGSTGHGTFNTSKTGNVNNETFGITGAVNFSGKVPAGSGLEPVGNNKITLKVPINKKDNVIFQFKLSKDEQWMFVTAYKNGIPEVKCKVKVDSASPSLNKLLTSPNASERSNALKMKELMSQSSTMDENKLTPIAHKLLVNKNRKGENA